MVLPPRFETGGAAEPHTIKQINGVASVPRVFG
jgi:hypothetical protein